ncbi:hypothetical protein EJB05_04696, partial [Eragrostis curvula]
MSNSQHSSLIPSCKGMESERRMDPALYKATTTPPPPPPLHGKCVEPYETGGQGPHDPQHHDAKASHGAPHRSGAWALRLHPEVLERSEGLLVAGNNDDDTPLHLAAKAGELEVARLLVVRGLAWPPNTRSPLIKINKAVNNPLDLWEAVEVALMDTDPARTYDLN